MRSKEQILENSCSQFGTFLYISGENCVIDGDASAALDAMDEYAKEVAIEFAKFRDKYKMNELREVKKEQERLGGIFTWMEASDERIFNQFLQEIKQDK